MFIVAQSIWTNLKQSFNIHNQPSSNLERNRNNSLLLIRSYQTDKKKSKPFHFHPLAIIDKIKRLKKW